MRYRIPARTPGRITDCTRFCVLAAVSGLLSVRRFCFSAGNRNDSFTAAVYRR